MSPDRKSLQLVLVVATVKGSGAPVLRSEMFWLCGATCWPICWLNVSDCWGEISAGLLLRPPVCSERLRRDCRGTG